MQDNFNQYMKIIAGEKPQRTQEKTLSEADKKKISAAYFQLFYSLSFANWLKRTSLGQAWYKAIEQLKSFISSKSPENPATMYMRQIFAAHKAKWSQLIMTSPLKDTQIECTPEKKQEWNMRVAKNTTDALKNLNDMLALYKTNEQPKQKTVQQSEFLSAQQKMQMLIMWQMQNQNERHAA